MVQSRFGPLAQSVEQGTFNPKVTGSIPVRPTTKPLLRGFLDARPFRINCSLPTFCQRDPSHSGHEEGGHHRRSLFLDGGDGMGVDVEGEGHRGVPETR